jgi:(p)ppGpp synthase/HD superfamily hydrolase
VFEAVNLRAVNSVARAREFAVQAYGSEDELEHPDEVAALVGEGDEELATAAILHDLVEDTDVELSQIDAEFGSRVAGLVAAMTEDSSIRDYGERKHEHRQRARDGGRDVATLFVADKLSNTRRMRRGQKKPDAKKLRHYQETLDTMRTAYPDLPLLPELDAELRAGAKQPGIPMSARPPEAQQGARA